MKKIRVLVVDDSALMRKLIPQILESDPGIEVAGTAMDGIFALKKIKDLKPDVITLDVNMPRMDGIETLRRLMGHVGVPVVIVSSLTRKNAEMTFRALENGAFDFVTKPQDALSEHIHEIGSELREKVRAAHENPVAKLKIAASRPGVPKEPGKIRNEGVASSLLAIGASTGGPNVLSYLLPQIPGDFPVPIVIVQHMPSGFTGMFAARLDALCRIEVKEAKDGDLVLPGRALIAPGNRHMKVKRLPLGGIAVLSDSPVVNGHRPSVDVLFSSAAEEYGSNAAGLLLTGMGSDGAEGMGAIKTRGGLTMAQDEESCVVFGMPRAAIERNYVWEIVPLESMVRVMVGHFGRKEDEPRDIKESPPASAAATLFP